MKMVRHHASAELQRCVADAGSAARELRTLRDLLRWAVSRFEAAGVAFGHGTDNARDEAVSLVLHALQLPPESPDLWLDARLTQNEREAVTAWIEERITTRLPAPYLTGVAWLRGLRFHCDRRALVPRSLIAEALEEALPEWFALHRPGEPEPSSVLDLCTGGGSLAIVAAHLFPDAHVVGSDLSPAALALAHSNALLHGLQGRIRWACSDLFAGLADERFSLILCNPPYVNAQSMQRLPAEFRHEPQEALAGGADGMDLIRRILAQARTHLETDGILLLEIGHEARHFESAFSALEFHYLPAVAGERMLVLIEARHLPAAG